MARFPHRFRCAAVRVATLALVPVLAHAVSVDFGVPLDPPLLKKFDMYNPGFYANEGGHDTWGNFERDFPKLREVGARSIRFDMSVGKDNSIVGQRMVDGDPSNPTYDWNSLDRLGKLVYDQNVIPYYGWGYIPLPLQRTGHVNWKDLDASNGWQDRWQRIYKAYASHAKGAGIRGFHEIYNEPDLGKLNYDWGFLDPANFDANYLDMYKHGALGIREGDPDATVGGPGYAAADFIGMAGFADFVQNNHLPLDFMSFHSYMDGTSWPGELDGVENELAKRPYFNSTELHINEFSWFAYGEDGSDDNSGPLSRADNVPRTLDVIKEIVGRTSVDQINWAMFTNCASNGMGLISWDGHKRAPYEAFKIYADLPEARRSISLESGLDGLAGADPHRAAVVVWNQNATDRVATIDLNALPFADGNFRLYRVDRGQASFYDGGSEEMTVQETKNVSGSKTSWTGTIPARGTVYIVLSDADARADFNRDSELAKPADFIKRYTWHPNRNDTYWTQFDRQTWTSQLGMKVDLEVALNAVEAEAIPDFLEVSNTASGVLQDKGVNSLLGVRVDYRTAAGYAKSVIFCQKHLYHARRDYPFPWGTKRQADVAVAVDYPNFILPIKANAPAGWDGRALISFHAQDLGAGSRATFVVRKPTTPSGLASAPAPANKASRQISVHLDKLHLRVDGLDETSRDVALLDMRGRRLAEGHGLGSARLDLPFVLKPGVYLVRLGGESGAWSRLVTLQ